ncbi:hypothetical protein [Leptolinea tardivitalis]|uniref:Uncharacterized protein n=1 Tax=Leptolinea tardivitalis TaxID=229920 RepID=A0A0P6WS95_9CHLR|nr:hypothetical protein [Leptolinea tardivitalis]KPL71822.1 hypothetical protein ADM99_10375 [Leptolinea tardivitalis]GAP20208.1 hypothetical protein LTAR_00396 [Leptolinea tardivitalis]
MTISTINPTSVSSSAVTTSSPLSNLSVESKETNEQRTLESSDGFSGVSSFAMAMHLSELSLSSTTTQFTYRSDNSLAIQARSQTNLKTRTEEYRFDITLSAESMGLTKEDFIDPTKPMTIKLMYSQSQLQISQKLTIQQVKTLRTPEEIMQDLVTALRDVFRDSGNKSVSYVLDSEAIEALAKSDPKIAELFYHLVTIMAMINLMKKQGEGSNDYTIYLSGKGKPYLDIQQETEGELTSQTYEFNITVEPPAAVKTAEPLAQSENAELPANKQT